MADEINEAAEQSDDRPAPMRQKVCDLPANATEKAVYARKGGDTYLKLNERFHVKAKLSQDRTMWLEDGMAEELDAEELVLRIRGSRRRPCRNPLHLNNQAASKPRCGSFIPSKTFRTSSTKVCQKKAYCAT